MVDEVHTRHHHWVIRASRASCALGELGLVAPDDSYGRHHHHFLGFSSLLAALRPNVNPLLISVQGGFEVQVGAERRSGERKHESALMREANTCRNKPHTIHTRIHLDVYIPRYGIWTQQLHNNSTFQEQGPADTAYLGGCIL